MTAMMTGIVSARRSQTPKRHQPFVAPQQVVHNVREA